MNTMTAVIEAEIESSRVAAPIAPGVAPRREECSSVSEHTREEYRFIDEEGNEYRYVDDGAGAAVVTDCDSAASSVVVPSTLGGRPVVAIGDNAFATSRRGAIAPSMPGALRSDAAAFAMRQLGGAGKRNAALERVVLPEGVRSIGRAAFRGCARLEEVVLPDTLERIDDLAFSCTGLRTLRLPARCTDLTPRALRLGPETISGEETPFRSKLEHVDVDPANPVLSMRGGVLCRRVDADRFEALLCPAQVDEVVLGPEIARVLPGAFAGTTRIGVFCASEGVEVVHEAGLLPQGTCGRLVIKLEHSVGDFDEAAIDLPESPLARTVLAAVAGSSPICAEKLLSAYDAALGALGDRLTQAKLMLARLASPVLLDPATRSAFTTALAPALESIAIHFGARGYWRGFDCLVDAGLLDSAKISEVITLLTSRGDTLAAAYLLNLKRRRFGKAAWDYEL